MATGELTLGTRIRQAREAMGMRQEDLAAALGSSVRAVNDWENDRTIPRKRGAIEKLLGISLYGEQPATHRHVPARSRQALRKHIPDDEDYERVIAILEHRANGGSDEQAG